MLRNGARTSNWTEAITKGDPVCDSQSTDNLKSDCGVLADLYNSADGENWTTKTNWNTSSAVGNWHGVTVSDGRVTQIRLPDNNLRGVIPNTFNALANLTHLYLHDNNLSGDIPAFANHFPTSLTHLYLHGNNLSGVIPIGNSQIGNTLSNLKKLNLSDNAFDIAIPADINNLTSLEQLNLYNNKIIGTIPALSALTSLVLLDFGSNSLDGTIPDLSSLDSLQTLYLDGNNLSGEIPDLSELDSLLYINFKDNSLGGTINSSGLGSASSKAHRVVISNNRLSGTIPDLSLNGYLQSLYLDGNNLSGTLDALASPSGRDTLHILDLSHNNISGTIPDLSSLSIQNLLIANNKLSGTLDNLTKLGDRPYNIFFGLDLGGNNLSGTIPDLSFFTNSGRHLTRILSLYGNSLSGSLPDLSSFTGTKVIDLSDNDFTGSIGDLGGSSGDLSVFSGLYVLDVSGNSLSGQIPVSSKLPGGLEYFQFNDNNLSGSVPSLSGLTKLKALGLWGNPNLTLTGITLPSGVNRSVIDWAALWTLHYKNNGYGWNSRSKWVGNSPMGEWHGVTTDSNGEVTALNLRNNNLRGGISGSIAALEKMTALNLSCNSSLSGELPLGLKDITTLTNVNICSTGMTLPSNQSFTDWKNRSDITFTDGACSPACPQPVS